MQKLVKKLRVPVTYLTLEKVVEAFEQKKQEVKLEKEDANSKKETVPTDAGSKVSKKELVIFRGEPSTFNCRLTVLFSLLFINSSPFLLFTHFGPSVSWDSFLLGISIFLLQLHLLVLLFESLDYLFKSHGGHWHPELLHQFLHFHGRRQFRRHRVHVVQGHSHGQLVTGLHPSHLSPAPRHRGEHLRILGRHPTQPLLKK